MQKLLRLTGFLPFILVIFINAFVDLGHKIMIQNSIFKIHDGEVQILLTAIVNGLILLPFVMLFSPAGFLADRFRKPTIMRISAAAALVLTLLITASYYMGWFEFAFGMTFLLAVQSAFYSPAKYGYIKELAGKEKLGLANAWVQAVTIVAILSGIFAFSWGFETALAGKVYRNEAEILQHIAPVGWMLVAFAAVELILTFKIPFQRPPADDMKFEWTQYGSGHYLRENLNKIWSNQNIWLSIVGLSVFWGISQVVLAAFPAFAKDTLGVTNTIVVQGVLACTGLGIILGSVLAGGASKHHIETGLVPLGACGVVGTLFLIPQLDSVSMLAIDFLALGVFGGLFIIPLNALIQFHAKDEELGSVLAGNNWVQNIVMLSFLGLTVTFAIAGIQGIGLFHILTLTAVVGAAYTIYRLPQSLVRYLLGRIFAGRYKVTVQGFEHIPGQGGVLMLGNHISWLDWAILQIACPRPIRFVMHREIYQRWYLKWFLDFFGVIPIASGKSKQALDDINELLKKGEVVCLFPEGAISRNGQLGEFKHGYERTVEGVDGVILPFYLRGLWGSRFSRSSDKLQQSRNQSMRREIIVSFGQSLPMSTPAEVLKRAVFDLSINSWDEHTRSLDTIPLAWIRQVKSTGGQLCLADAKGGMALSGYKALTAAIVFSRLMRAQCREQNVGLLLPTSSAGVITNMAALLLGKTIINLNYTANEPSLKAAISKGGVKTLYTSRRFIARLASKGIDLNSLLRMVTVYYLEDFKEQISPVKKLAVLAMVRLLPARLLYHLFGRQTDINDPAAILFSSGSEGDPKGVVLSHRNIMGNIKQVSDVLDTRQEDVVMASLPLFHAFGLTVTGLMPLVEGIPTVCHPDPTDVLNIAKAIGKYRATIFCGTSTFLRLFTRNRKIHPLMLESLRVVVAGAERMSPEVRDAFKLKFNKEIYEGYGTTETTPVASVNIPDRIDPRDWDVQAGSKPGTVGMPLPGSSFRIVDPETLETLETGVDGLILIGGTQVMRGYLDDPEKTEEVIVELDGRRWYKSGDKGHLDQDGFLTIVDRYSRFAKIAGEMISLGAIESAINKLLPEDTEILATALPDGKKGEKVALLYSGSLQQDGMKALLSRSGLNPLMIPAELIAVECIPKLGSGKSDFKQAKQLAMEAASCA
jgi:acyl-[acyl-carrier-protein]-phospholipid O-acyltransferase/long-chain-fatty-acid--[acyl-carrier-protein] ligase